MVHGIFIGYSFLSIYTHAVGRLSFYLEILRYFLIHHSTIYSTNFILSRVTNARLIARIVSSTRYVLETHTYTNLIRTCSVTHSHLSLFN